MALEEKTIIGNEKYAFINIILFILIFTYYIILYYYLILFIIF